MPNWPRKKGTYYDRECEARREYQREYYAQNKEALARKRELERELDPEAYQKRLEYARNQNRKVAERKRAAAAKNSHYRETEQSE
jgi:hypothetical protein